MADALGRGDLGGHGVPVIARPVRAVGGTIGAASHQLRDRCQPARRGDRLRAGAVGDRGDHRRVVGAGQRLDTRQLEHTFEV